MLLIIFIYVKLFNFFLPHFKYSYSHSFFFLFFFICTILAHSTPLFVSLLPQLQTITIPTSLLPKLYYPMNLLLNQLLYPKSYFIYFIKNKYTLIISSGQLYNMISGTISKM